MAETDSPGAPISGLAMIERIAGPRDDEPTMVPTSGIPSAGSMRMVTPASMPLLKVSEVSWLTM